MGATGRSLTERLFPAAEWPRLVAARRRELAEPEHYVPVGAWPPDARLADLGCGPGFFLPALLATLGPAGRLVAVDAQAEMLEVLRERLGPRPRVRPVCAPLDALPLPDASVDVAWCAFVLHEVAALDAVVAEAVRVLAPGGRLLVLEWDPRPTDHGPPAAERVASEVVAAAMARGGLIVHGPRPVTDSQYRLDGLR